MTRPVILASPYRDGVKLEPQSYLGSLFNAYREAVTRCGARYIGSIRANVLTVDRLGLLREALDAAGFDLAVHPDLRDSLLRAAEQAQAVADAGAVRLTVAEQRLQSLGLTLYGYQRDGVRWLAPRHRALLADEMGLGKTPEALMALPDDARAMVIAPAAVAGNWLRETRRWRPDLRPAVLNGRATWRWPAPGELIIATYGALPTEDQEITLPPAGVYLIADEAHALKGSRGRKIEGGYKGGVQRVRRWFGVQEAVADAGGTVWLLTGTPLINRPPELWRVLQAAGLAQDAFGSYPRFVELVGGHRGRHGMVYDGQMSDEVPLALQKVSLRRERATVLPDLPRKQREVDQVAIADAQAIRLCDELLAHLEGSGYTVDVLADMGQLAKDVREVVFALLSKVRAALAAAKIPALLEHIETYEEEEVPVVVFSAHLAPLKALAARPGWALIDGSVPTEARAQTVETFQAGGLKGLACSFAAGGVGITLTHAHHVICVDLPWTPALLQQAEDRLCRIGQAADSVHVRILAADHPVDQRVAELLVEKAVLIEATIEASAVESVGLDTKVADDARNLAVLAEQTSETAARAIAEREAQERDRAQVEAGREARARGDFTQPVPEFKGFRPPSTPEECHAAQAMIVLAQLDPDHAGEVNEAGFSKFDGEFGHSLAQALIQYGRLSDKQWAAALKLAVKYRRQVGEAPAEQSEAAL